MIDGLDATLRAASRGDTAAWRELVEQYGPRVFGLLRSRCGDAELAEELTQSVFCTIAEKLGAGEASKSKVAGRYVENGKFEPWLFQIAMNRLRDEMRRRKRQAVGSGTDEAVDFLARREASGFGGGAEEVELEDEKHRQFEVLQEAMSELNDADREVIELRHMGGLTYKQIAEVLDEPMGTVLARQHRALRKLKDLLEGSIRIPFAES